ncbi:MAG: glycosyltransferase family 4 protein [Rubellimicrobium sp.]|nr:glycosyltransferase family 4 protein [Rubellimicrobium sp.]
MTLFINARFLTQPLSGVQRYARELVSALDARLADDAGLARALGPVTAFHPADLALDRTGPLPDWRAIRPSPLRGGRGHLWEQGALLSATRGGVLLSLGNSGPLLHPRQVIAFHDTHLWDMPEAFACRYRLWHGMLRPRLARRAAEIVTVSEHAARALSARLAVAVERFGIVPNGADHILRLSPDPDVPAALGLTRGGYLLAVGNLSPNKNIARLVAAHAMLPTAPPLVIAGGPAPGVTSASPAAGGRVIAAGRVSDAGLRALYEGAAGFVFVSLHEGFGIPPLEAMALGVPVLASRRAPLPEILGEAPLWCDPEDTADIARGIALLAAIAPAERAARIGLGLAQAAGHTWQASAARLIGRLLEMSGGAADDLSFPSGAAGQALSPR